MQAKPEPQRFQVTDLVTSNYRGNRTRSAILLQIWKHFDSPSRIDQFEVLIDIRRQPDIAMPHKFLSRPRRYSAASQHRTKRMPQRMNIHASAMLVYTLLASSLFLSPVNAASR